ncbi:MAG: hypothetical protein M1546_10660 [Chloroflexi bacterium]|nr:hypothetical protein [Chloroflexota bacterium]
MLFFSVLPNARQTYLRDRVIGVSLWLNGGENTITTEDLMITLVGSNAYAYGVSGDTSVTVNDQLFFSETKLYDLGVNRPIPPNTWVELVVYLDKLPYDPDYKYLTGIYVKNEKGFLKTVHIDYLSVLMVK